MPPVVDRPELVGPGRQPAVAHQPGQQGRPDAHHRGQQVPQPGREEVHPVDQAQGALVDGAVCPGGGGGTTDKDVSCIIAKKKKK